MNRAECTHEPLIVEAVLSGTWPHRVDDALVAHADGCATCSEVALIASLLHDDYERSRYDARVPAAGQVWWRSAIRARLELTHSVVRPLAWLHAIAAAMAIGLLLAIATVAWPYLAPVTDRVWSVAVGFLPHADVAAALASGLRLTAMLGAVAAAILVLAPLAVYFALSRD